MLETAGQGRADRFPRAATAAGTGDEHSLARTAWYAALGTAGFALALGSPLIVVAANGDHLR